MRGFVDRIAQILCHQAQWEVRGEVVCGRAGCGPLDDSAAWSAASEDGFGFRAVKPARLNQRHCFRKRSRLHATHEIVDQLQERTASGGAQMNYVTTQDREGGLSQSERRGGTSHQKKKFA